MVAGGYLNEKSVLEIWAARPPDTTPFYQRAAISRALGEKYKVCYKTVQKIWRKASWAKLTDRAPVPAQSEGQDVSPDPAIYTGTTADTTADSLAEVEAGMGPEHSMLPRVSSTPSASPFFSVHDNLPSPLNSNFSVAANDGIIPDSSLLPPPSSLLFPPAPPYLARELSPLQFSNFATQDSVPHDQTDRQEIVIASHFDTEEPLSSLASNWVPANSRARHVEGRQCRLGTACFRCKAQRLNFGGNQPRGVCIMDLASEFAVESGRDPLLPSVILHSEHSTYTPVTGGHRRVVAPEHPIAYPDGPITGVTYVVPQEKGPDSPWPLSMVRLFRGYRLADGIWWRMLQLMTPKLRATTLRVFRTLDNQFLLAQLGHIPPKIPSEWSKPSQNSLRCGIMTLRMDGRSDQMTGIDANPFWTDLAGLHKEEFANRAFSCEMHLPSSELRQFCKMMFILPVFLKWRLGLTHPRGGDPSAPFDLQPMYLPFARDWGRGKPSGGILTRMRVTTTSDKHDPRVTYVNTSIVVITPEEFEAVRAQQPELCEGYLIPVVGSKSAAELMDPRLFVEESFENMASSGEGRAQMDRLADVITAEYSFLFDNYAEEYSPAPSQADS